ncbi:glutamate synthase, partial [Dehalococcoides mccartyi]
MKTFLPSKFIVDRIEDRCIKCKVCIT